MHWLPLGLLSLSLPFMLLPEFEPSENCSEFVIPTLKTSMTFETLPSEGQLTFPASSAPVSLLPFDLPQTSAKPDALRSANITPICFWTCYYFCPKLSLVLFNLLNSRWLFRAQVSLDLPFLPSRAKPSSVLLHGVLYTPLLQRSPSLFSGSPATLCSFRASSFYCQPYSSWLINVY